MANIKNNNQQLISFMKRKNITSVELARLLHIEISMMKAIETGIIRPSLETLIKMCKILDISADTLILNETRSPLSLKGLTPEQIQTVRYMYIKLKELGGDK